MKFNNQVIKKNNKISFLICFNKMIKFYKKFGWVVISKKNFLIGDYKSLKKGMFFNRKVLSKKKYIFYLLK